MMAALPPGLQAPCSSQGAWETLRSTQLPEPTEVFRVWGAVLSDSPGAPGLLSQHGRRARLRPHVSAERSSVQPMAQGFQRQHSVVTAVFSSPSHFTSRETERGHGFGLKVNV